jgi:hypothetical protein
MSRRKKKKRSNQRRSKRETQPVEARQAEFVTVAWMLAMLATLSAEVVGIIARLVMIAESVTAPLQMLSGTMLIVAFVSGVVTLVLTPVVLRIRKVAPPRPIIAAACVIGVIPVATLVMIAVR